MSNTLCKTLSIVVPCYNESTCIRNFYVAVCEVCNQYLQYNYEFIFVNDGSSDSTQYELEMLSSDSRVKIIEFSRNFGKEAALTAGLRASTGDMVVPIDSDLQHPPSVIFELVERFKKGDVDVVIAKRRSRNTESLVYKTCTKLFYDVQSLISECDMPRDAGDFRLMSREVTDVLCSLPENRRFMKGLYAWVGFKSAFVEYDVAERIGGNSKFGGMKLLSLAANGILDFSSFPLRMWMWLGFIVSFVAFIYGIWIIARTLIIGIDTPGWATLMVVVLFLGGIQLVSIGVLGEYIGRVYSQIKGRPTYIIRSSSSVKDCDE